MRTSLQQTTIENSGTSSLAPVPTSRQPLPSSQKQIGPIRLRPLAWTLLSVLGVGGLCAWTASHWFPQHNNQSAEITATVTRATLPVIVRAGGEIESSRTIDVICEVEGQQIKIIEMLAEGTRVTAGQVVLRFDAAEFNRSLSEAKVKLMKAESLAKAETEQLKIEQNKADSDVAKANLALTLAELDRKKYVEGDFGVQLDDLKGSIALAQTDLEEATTALEYFQELVKKGFRTPEQLRAKEQAVKRAEYFVSRDQSKLRVLEQFTYARQVAELEFKAKEAVRELARAESNREATVTKAKSDLEAARETERLEKSILARLEKQLERCTVKAPQDGILVYASGPNESNRIRLGAVVHFKQKLFSLPDMTQMRVKSYVHEAVVQKVKSGLKAEVRIDAYPNAVMHGTVEEVSTFYDPERQWALGGVKDYLTNVKIDDLPDVGLKPGMTAEVKILVNNVPDALVVPLQAVAEQAGKYYCYVVGPQGVERREVAVGESNDNFIEIKAGLSEGERLVLNTRARISAESKASEQVEKGLSTPEQPAPTDLSSEAGSQPGS